MSDRGVIARTQAALVDQLDDFIAGRRVMLPPAEVRRACDSQLEHRSGSVRVASLFLAFVAAQGPSWDCDTIPVGIRGNPGDKGISAALNERHVTLHKNTVAFGENLGWKGNVTGVRLSADPRFREFAAMLRDADAATRKRAAEYMASRFADSRREVRPLPPVPDDVLTFARAKLLFTRIIALPTEGHVQQFLIAALLETHRRRHGLEVRTHHPHGRDSDPNAPGKNESAGDVEEFHDGRLVRAYEVTVRPDWKSRLAGFRAKMDKFGLQKYVIIASNVNADDDLAEPARLINFLKPTGRDIAVVDIADVTNVMAGELTASELREAVNRTYDLLCQPKLCGRDDFQRAYREVVDDWLDEQGNQN